MTSQHDAAARTIADGHAVLGIELGSTNIKACLIDASGTTLATGSSAWENRWADGYWTYGLDEVWSGIAEAFAALKTTVATTYGCEIETLAALGVSAMMHGYLAFDADGNQLVDFRTWRNTNTGRAAQELTDLLGTNIPLRWSVAHLHQAILDGEEHVPRVDFLTTLAGYVHWRLTGERVLGIGDASGMFPVDSRTLDYDAERLATFDAHVGDALPGGHAKRLFPAVVPAGTVAGHLSADGARRLDPTGVLRPGAPLCPPEGDAGTGMVATNSVRPRTGNVSVGTSIFAMVVLDAPLREVHSEIDLVTTPAGPAVAMVHCNNGADELSRWVRLFTEAARALGAPDTMPDDAFEALLSAAESGAPDAGGFVAFNNTSGEPITGLDQGRPLLVRGSESELSLANVMRAQVYSIFATLAIGLDVLRNEGVELEKLNAHGGLFKTAGVAQRFLAAATDTRTVVAESAGEGGAWGIALLAAYLEHADRPLEEFLAETVFSDVSTHSVTPAPEAVAGFRTFLAGYRRGLAVEAAAVDHLTEED